ncbi:MAG: tetratricopeptide repeat protein [Roseateles sp.]|uniref:tetratricopeptide repeat protein n=1 Tax=Roseateles sp. TaxID=1971397 RepID=UPI0039E734D5
MTAAIDRLNRLLDYLAQDPRNPQLLADVADLQLQLGDWGAAKSTLQQQLQRQPGDALARYRLAVAERAVGNAAEALPLLQALISEGHAHAAVVQELARCHAQQGNWSAVVSELASQEATKLPPDDADAVRLLRIRAQHHLGDLEAALAESRAWQAGRGHALPVQGWAAIATLLLDAERMDDAAQLLAQAGAEAIQGNAELAAAAGFVELGRGQLDGALGHFVRSTSIEPRMGRAHLGQGLVLAAQGDMSRAIEALKVAVEVSPDHLGSWHALAWMQLLSRDVEGAAASFQSALSRDDNFGETHGGLALVAALRGDRQSSERHLRTASKLDAASVNAMVARMVLEHGPGMLDSELLGRALDRFVGSTAGSNPALQAMWARMTARAT